MRLLYEFKVIEEYDDQAPEDFGFVTLDCEVTIGSVVMLKWLDGRDAYKVKVKSVDVRSLTMRVERTDQDAKITAR